MQTRIIAVDPAAPDPEAIAGAAEALRSGELVGFPTETVYGLGANALDSAAVARIFEAKGRPSNNPIIVHVADAASARELVTEWPDEAASLAERFWPGPLTLVLPRRDIVPDVVTGGGPTVGIRVPAHPVALALLQAARIPIAAPSANRSTEVSPTTAAHVLKGLDGRIALLVDGGPTSGGIESTVLDLSSHHARLLRPGLVSAEQIEEVIGPIERSALRESGAPLPSPGMMKRHYAPRVPVELAVDSGRSRVEELVRQGHEVGWVTFEPEANAAAQEVFGITMPRDARAYAADLYSVLHWLDAPSEKPEWMKGWRLHRIIVELPPDTPEWQAIRDRLMRAASREPAE